MSAGVAARAIPCDALRELPSVHALPVGGSPNPLTFSFAQKPSALFVGGHRQLVEYLRNLRLPPIVSEVATPAGCEVRSPAFRPRMRRRRESWRRRTQKILRIL